MNYFIETKDDFIKFKDDYINHPVILLPVFKYKNVHYKNNKIILFFIKILNENRYYIISLDHSDCINVNKNVIQFLLSSDNKKYVISKKDIMINQNATFLIDISVLYYLRENSNLSLDIIDTSAEKFILNNNMDYSYVPIMKIIEKQKNISDQLNVMINTYSDMEIEDSFEFKNNITIDSLLEIEKSGICVDENILLKFHPNYKLLINNNLIYSDYNIFTLTGRPSNSFSNLNFSALNKDNGERSFIISRFGDNGRLLYFDYDSYHLNLIANIINYTFPNNISVHEYLGKQYFGKDSLTEEEYDQSKRLSFNILYGGIDKSISEAIPFYNNIQIFIDELWNDFNEYGYIKTYISKKKLYKDKLDSMNPNKLFNYYLQNYETEKNILIINKINKFIKNYESKLIMYLYDGFLFDYNLEDGKEMFVSLKKIIEDNNNFKTKQYFGKNFNDMKQI